MERRRVSLTFRRISVLSTRNRPPQRDCVVDPHFREDLEHWIANDRKTALRILRLVEAIMRDPFDGIGKPERLRHLDPDMWSRRITQEHRLVYYVEGDRITLLQARYHYDS